MSSRRQFVAGLGAAGLGAVLPMARSFAESNESSMARIKRTKTLRTGVVAGAAPYFAKSVATGQWQGFGPDFARQLAQSLGVKLQLVETTWGNAVLDLQANKIDCMFGMAPTEQRKKMVGFTAPLFQNTFTLVARKGFDPKTWAEVDQPKVRISVDIGSNQDTFATQTLKKATIQRFDTSGDATLALQTGRADGQLLVALLGVTVLAKAPGLGHLIVPTPVEGAPTSIGVQKETDTAFLAAVNEWLAKMRSSGETRKIILENMEKLVGIKAADFPKEVVL
ncbi:transporter substrate-binding domain-containing protein [Paralcaligenes ureilyticus]|uniref:Amino acid ABC transporter substrate-binding protein (PAAT family) n=1 Tax=Paralcaligenes ureilyticus TaxID=627131 RepID=A0A4R3MAY6_9BURK|nr:transporter substrate-binding domain-containing protein [Paralcaligenes ureilyticus]TCT10302.1 amino acid ABC transporter substrate-binding protein (PAAT family) [Paralcaligenes ureilyticus]